MQILKLESCRVQRKMTTTTERKERRKQILIQGNFGENCKFRNCRKHRQTSTTYPIKMLFYSGNYLSATYCIMCELDGFVLVER